MGIDIDKYEEFVNLEQYNACGEWNHKVDCICMECLTPFSKTRQGIAKSIRNNGFVSCSATCTKVKKGTAVRPIIKRCANCGAKVTRKASDLAKSRLSFCSLSCSASFNNKGVDRHGNSRKSKAVKRLQQVKEESSNISSNGGKMFLVECLYCEKDLHRETSRLSKTGKNYCNQECKTKHDWEIYKKEIAETGSGNPRGNKHLPSAAKRYLREVRGNVCEICGTEKWMGDPVPLVLDHINGDPADHLLQNLRLVCGNCDMQLPTYKAKNTGNGRASRRKRYAEGKSY